jgi:hypothetical protein
MSEYENREEVKMAAYTSEETTRYVTAFQKGSKTRPASQP